VTPKLPRISGEEAIRRLKKFGFTIARQRGSHVRLEQIQEGKLLKITIPLHKELKTGTLHRIIIDSGLTHEEFAKA
jgi:predicted RNA binding protein YcfA (HicA-like mRNA interferase family)